MRRRDFVKRVSGAAAALSVGALGCRGTRAAALPRHWTWVHGGAERTPDEWLAAFARVREAGIGGVHVSGGDIEVLSAAAQEAGVAFHRWIWTLNRSGDQWVREHHPEWFTVSREGKSTLEHPPYVGYYRWLCPTRPEVREYLRTVVDELAADPHVAGVHLDYVRHSDVILPVGLWEKYGLVQDREYPEFDFCYCEVCRETFAAQTGIDPLDLPDSRRRASPALSCASPGTNGRSTHSSRCYTTGFTRSLLPGSVTAFATGSVRLAVPRPCMPASSFPTCRPQRLVTQSERLLRLGPLVSRCSRWAASTTNGSPSSVTPWPERES
jgi:hypothetical protein